MADTITAREALEKLKGFQEIHGEHRGHEALVGEWGIFAGCSACAVYETLRVDNEAYRRAVGAELSEERSVSF